MNELLVQRDLAKAAKAVGGFGYKANNRFLVGVLDLAVWLPGEVATMVEVKYAPRFGRNGVNLEMTVHQAKMMRDIQRAGGNAGWLMVVGCGNLPGFKRGDFALMTGREPQFETFKISNKDPDWMYRDAGKPWPIAEVIRRLRP